MKRAARVPFAATLFGALALAPLALAAVTAPFPRPRPFALEFAVGLGFVAFALLVLEFALVARVHRASRLFGTDALLLFHREMGIAAALLAAGHVALLLAGDLPVTLLLPIAPAARSLTAGSGAVAFWSMLALVASALARRRCARRHEVWRRAHAGLALLAVAATVVHLLASAGYTRAPAVRVTVLAFGATAFALMFRYRVVHPWLAWRRPWEIVANRAESGDVRTLVLRPAGHAGFRFAPGQFVWITTGRSPFAAEEHPMSIASSAARPPGSPIELSIKALGDWSRDVVPTLATGTRVWIDGPFGDFTPTPTASGFVLVAGGIGLTPILSLLRTLRDRGDRRPILLFVAARNRERAIFADELEELARALALTLVFVFEEPGAAGATATGFVTAALLRRFGVATMASREFLACGPGPMVDALDGALAELGVDPARLRTERFDLV